MMEELSNPYFLLAFVVAPAVVVAFGWVIVMIHERSLHRDRQAPGE